MPSRWIQLADLQLPPVDVNTHPLVGVYINEQWRETLLSLVSHAEQARFWESNDTDRIEQNAYTLYRLIRKANRMIGMIAPYASINAPMGMLPCNGTTYNRADYPELYAVIDTSYIIDSNTFKTPDLRGKFILSANATYTAHSTGGEETHTLTTDEMPTHSHTTQPHTHSTVPHGHSTDYPSIGIDLEGAGVPDVSALGNPPFQIAYSSLETVTVNNAGVTVDNAGAGEPHNNMPPYLALNYGIICY